MLFSSSIMICPSIELLPLLFVKSILECGKTETYIKNARNRVIFEERASKIVKQNILLSIRNKEEIIAITGNKCYNTDNIYSRADRIYQNIPHNAGIYRNALVKRIWLALCSRGTRNETR